MKITNDLLAQYLENKAIIKTLTEANDTIAIVIKAQGGAQTADYIAIVEDKERRTVAGVKSFETTFGPGWLEAHGLLNISQYQQVTVAPRKDKKGAAS